MELFQPTKISLGDFFLGPPWGSAKKLLTFTFIEAGGGLKGITASGAELPEPAAGLLGPGRSGKMVARSVGRSFGREQPQPQAHGDNNDNNNRCMVANYLLYKWDDPPSILKNFHDASQPGDSAAVTYPSPLG